MGASCGHAASVQLAPFSVTPRELASTSPQSSSSDALPPSPRSRAAMLGFLIAVGAELATGRPVTGQLFDVVMVKSTHAMTHAIDGLSFTSYAFVVLAVTMGSLAPLVTGAKDASNKSFGPFTPAAEMQNGRAAMMGFAALLGVEAIKGSALF